MAFQKEDRYRMTVAMTDGTIKTYYPTSKEQKNKNYNIFRLRRYKILECVKLYPFNTERNQHNFELIHNICFNDMHDMETGEKPWDEELYDILEKRKERAEYFFCLPLPLAWIPYTELEEAKEMATAAILHRQNACIEHGRPDLVQYC